MDKAVSATAGRTDRSEKPHVSARTDRHAKDLEWSWGSGLFGVDDSGHGEERTWWKGVKIDIFVESDLIHCMGGGVGKEIWDFVLVRLRVCRNGTRKDGVEYHIALRLGKEMDPQSGGTLDAKAKAEHTKKARLWVRSA
jgi:hypothetical protein